MLEILCKVSFFLSMLVAYAYVTSTSKVIVVILAYGACVFSYYYFNIIQSAIDDFLKYFSLNEKFEMTTPPITSPFLNGVESASFIKYPSRHVPSYRFDKSTLRHLSKVPRMSSSPAVRIAPPEPMRMTSLNDKYIRADRNDEEVKGDSVLQVLKEISRKRNFQEESDRTENTPKKSRRNDLKNLIHSHHKRTHDDSSKDDLEDSNRKKRCNDTDRSVAKMMSYTSSLSVLAPDFAWSNNSKKRKSSKISKSMNESPENVEKHRKISGEDSTIDLIEKRDRKKSISDKVASIQVNEPEVSVKVDETDNDSIEVAPPFDDDEGEYIRVAGGKILNRTNCTYRKKLNSSKIDPGSVISLEPELVNGSFDDVDDEAMKENLLKNILDDIERKGEKDDTVIFYQNSIVEEVALNESKKEKKTELPNTQTNSFNPLLSPPTPSITEKQSFNVMPSPINNQNPPTIKMKKSVTFGENSTFSFDNSGKNSPQVETSTNTNVNPATFNFTPNQSSIAFGTSVSNINVDTVDSPKISTPIQPAKNESPISSQLQQSSSTPVKPVENTVVSSPKNTFSFPTVVSMAPSNSFAQTTNVSSSMFNTPVSSPEQKETLKKEIASVVPASTSSFTFGSSSEIKFEKAPSSLCVNSELNKSNTNSLSGITMFGNTSLNTTNSPNSDTFSAKSTEISFGSTQSLTNTTNSSTLNAFSPKTTAVSFGLSQGTTNTTNSPTQNAFSPATTSVSFGSASSTEFKFGSTPVTKSGGFSFGSSTPGGFKFPTPTTSAPAFSSSFNATSAPSFSTSSSTFAGATPTFRTNFNATTTSSSFESGNTLSFGTAGSSFNPTTTSNASFGSQSSSFTFGSTTQPQVSSFGAAPSNAFSTTQAPTFGSANNSTTFSANTGSLQFGATSTTSQFGATGATQFGATSIAPQFGVTSAPQFSANSAKLQFGGTNTTNTAPQFGATSTTSQFGATGTSQFGTTGTASQFSATSGTNLMQPTSQFGNTGTFTFGSNTSNPPAFGGTPATAASFNAPTTTTQSNFSATPSFNFSAGAASFGGSTFGGVAAQTKSADIFNFGNNANTPAIQPAQNQGMFQFGAAATTPQASQPFTFAAGAAPAGVGGFSIGAGGSSRNRASRSRRNK